MSGSKPHDSAVGHVTGTAEYIDDRTFLRGEAHVEIYYSPIAHAKIKSVNINEARMVPGVLGIFTHEDLQHNLWGSIFQDQVFLAVDRVQFAGEAIAVIAAETKSAALTAKRLIQVDFEPEEPILELQDAIDKKSFIGDSRSISRGDTDLALKNSPNRLSGHVDMAGQDHFYLESHACIAYPKEDNQIEIHASSQHPTEVQHLVAEALGLKFNQVVCIVKRMGGAFGGKESQAGLFAVFAALVAHKLKRPARLILSKDDDMIMTGKRNPFRNFYDVGFDNDGKILALKAELYSDGGAYADLSTAIMERAMLHIDNAYFIENMLISGQVCKTHTPPNTAFRGFGGPKGVATIESIIEDIALKLKKDSFSIRQLNLYRKGQKTHYDQIIDDDVLPELFDQLGKQTEYLKWRSQIDEHNQNSKTTIKGLSATAVKFGISFTTRFLNQGNALVNLHLDGTVQVSTGATEMGQGVNIKIAQIIADCFSIPVEDIRVMPTSTEKNPNTSATAASSGTDINGQATLNACLELKQTLSKVAICVLNRPDEWRGRPTASSGNVEEIDLSTADDWESVVFENSKVFDPNDKRKSIDFSQLIEEAYLNRQPLSAQGFFKYPGIHFDKTKGKGQPFFYFTNGIAASEVSIDRFTGELKVLRTELIMDLGRPLNHGVDIGQVTGAFIQGMGWVSTENLFYDKGVLRSCSPSTYKIPTVHDVPRIFNCSFIENHRNIKNVKASKAVGEPPLLLAISVWAAIKNALGYATGETQALKIPATQEHIYRHLRGIASEHSGPKATTAV